MRAIEFSEQPLRLADLDAVARGDAAIVVAARITERLHAMRDIVLRLASSAQPIYGLNSALGANTGKPFAASSGGESLVDYQLNAVRARSVGVGAPFPADVVREGYRANLSPFDPRMQAARPAAGQFEAAQRLTALLENSGLSQPGAARRVQDPLSFRCLAQVHGAARACWNEAGAQVETELNSAADSPLVLDTGEMLSNGNFHVPALAIALEALGLGLAQCAALCVERALKQLSPALSGLPLQLTRHGPSHSGFATVQKTLTALLNRIRHLANPACLDFLPVSEMIEDHACMTLNVVDKTLAMVEPLLYLAAIEALIGAQAVDLREPSRRTSLGRGADRLYTALRTEIPMLDGDRPLGPDIEAAARLLRELTKGTA
ncbi:MAG: aromatic amino acid lyase [Betaproteobacteria bacterium]